MCSMLVSSDLIVLREGKETKEFWDIIGGKETYATTERLKVCFLCRCLRQWFSLTIFRHSLLFKVETISIISFQQ